MEHEWKYWPPIFYTMVWLAGFLIGIFGFMPDATGPMKLVVGAYTAYVIFLANAFIDYLCIIADNKGYCAKPMIANVNIIIFALTFIAIFFTYIFVNTQKNLFFFISSAIMVATFFGMEWIKHNPSICYILIKGKAYQTNLR